MLLGAEASIVKLTGATDSFVEFHKGPTSTARLTATCDGVQPAIFYTSPDTIDYIDASKPASVKVMLGNVVSCGSITSLREPCVTSSHDWPALFHCVFRGEASEVVGTAIRAEREFDQFDGVTLGSHTFLMCAVPDVGSLSALHGAPFTGAEVVLNISVRHFAATRELPFDGLPGGAVLKMRNLPAPSTPPLPPSLPPPSPTLPPPPSLPPLAPFTVVEKGQTCASVGRLVMASVAECQAVATTYGDTKVGELNNGHDLAGCFMDPRYNTFWYNSNTGTASKAVSSAFRRAVCAQPSPDLPPPSPPPCAQLSNLCSGAADGITHVCNMGVITICDAGKMLVGYGTGSSSRPSVSYRDDLSASFSSSSSFSILPRSTLSTLSAHASHVQLRSAQTNIISSGIVTGSYDYTTSYADNRAITALRNSMDTSNQARTRTC